MLRGRTDAANSITRLHGLSQYQLMFHNNRYVRQILLLKA
jgi:hypothetical protein